MIFRFRCKHREKTTFWSVNYAKIIKKNCNIFFRLFKLLAIRIYKNIAFNRPTERNFTMIQLPPSLKLFELFCSETNFKFHDPNSFFHFSDFSEDPLYSMRSASKKWNFVSHEEKSRSGIFLIPWA